MVLKELREDVKYAHEVSGARPTLPYAWASPSIRCATYMRIAARGGFWGKVMRARLLSAFSCDVSAGARIAGGLFIPHPVGIVIGIGVVLHGRTHIYQGVTLGANARGEYPTIEPDVKVYPNSVITGGVNIGRGALIGAGAYVFNDVQPHAVVRGPSTRIAD